MELAYYGELIGTVGKGGRGVGRVRWKRNGIERVKSAGKRWKLKEMGQGKEGSKEGRSGICKVKERIGKTDSVRDSVGMVR